MKTALVGYTGFIGSNIASQKKFTDYYNSKNIAAIRNKTYDLIVSAATSSLRWKANIEPEKDWKAIQSLLHNLKKVSAKHFVLISTVDVYDHPVGVTEDAKITVSHQNAYGHNRYKMERFIKKHFSRCTIVRIPQTFGDNLKKNFIFDLINNHSLDFTHKESIFQWYNLKNLWEDIEFALDYNIEILNLAVEPISAKEVAKYTLHIDYQTITDNPPLQYDMRTQYATLRKKTLPYFYDKKSTLRQLRQFIARERKRL